MYPLLCYNHIVLLSYLIISFNGGDKEIRTPDPLLARQVLSQLSYAPIFSHFKLRSLSPNFVSFLSHVLYTLLRHLLICLKLLVLNVKIYLLFLTVSCTIKTAYHPFSKIYLVLHIFENIFLLG